MKTDFSPCSRRVARPLRARAARRAAKPATNFDAVQRADGARVVPEKFLRDWDPVTVFFDSDAGPKNGGPPTRMKNSRA